MYRIGLFSKLTTITIKTLRYYDDIGLLKPAFIDNETGYRFYKTSQVVPLHNIISLRQVGFSLNEIRQIISGDNLDLALDMKKDELEAELLEIENRLFRLTHLISENKENFMSKYQATIKEVPEYITYYRKGKIADYSKLTEFILSIGAEIRAANSTLTCPEPGYCFTTYHDGGYKDKDISIEYCEAVSKFGNETENIKFKILPATKVASAYHVGSYDKLYDAHLYLINWLNNTNYKVLSAPRTVYIDGVWNSKVEKEFLTEIQIPIAEK